MRPTASDIEVAGGGFFDVLEPRASDVRVSDVARALANTCRFAGHTRVFYSVAEHAVHVAGKLAREGLVRHAFAGLHHDDAEAYVGDVPRPLKAALGAGWRRIEARVDAAVVSALGGECDWPVATWQSPAVAAADNWMLAVEARLLLPSRGEGWVGIGETGWPLNLAELPGPLGLDPAAAEARFLYTHRMLRAGLGVLA